MSIDERILRFLTGLDWPTTTEGIARELQVSWNTAQLHLYKLMAGGKVRGKRVGRQNQWAVVRKAIDE